MKTSARSAPRRIQLRRTRGWRKPANTIVVARPTKWGNPFVVGTESVYGFVTDRETSVKYYQRWIKTAEGRALARAAREELRGKNLACWCSLDGPCHGNILLKLANG